MDALVRASGTANQGLLTIMGEGGAHTADAGAWGPFAQALAHVLGPGAGGSVRPSRAAEAAVNDTDWSSVGTCPAPTQPDCASPTNDLVALACAVVAALPSEAPAFDGANEPDIGRSPSEAPPTESTPGLENTTPAPDPRPVATPTVLVSDALSRRGRALLADLPAAGVLDGSSAIIDTAAGPGGSPAATADRPAPVRGLVADLDAADVGQDRLNAPSGHTGSVTSHRPVRPDIPLRGTTPGPAMGGLPGPEVPKPGPDTADGATGSSMPTTEQTKFGRSSRHDHIGGADPQVEAGNLVVPIATPTFSQPGASVRTIDAPGDEQVESSVSVPETSGRDALRSESTWGGREHLQPGLVALAPSGSRAHSTAGPPDVPRAAAALPTGVGPDGPAVWQPGDGQQPALAAEPPEGDVRAPEWAPTAARLQSEGTAAMPGHASTSAADAAGPEEGPMPTDAPTEPLSSAARRAWAFIARAVAGSDVDSATEPAAETPEAPRPGSVGAANGQAGVATGPTRDAGPGGGALTGTSRAAGPEHAAIPDHTEGEVRRGATGADRSSRPLEERALHQPVGARLLDVTHPLAGPTGQGAASPVGDVPGARVASEANTVTQAYERTTLDERPLAEAMVRTLRFQPVRDGVEARIDLRPEHLGDLRVVLRVTGSSVSAVLTAESSSVRAWVEAHQRDLRVALGEAGLSLDELRVDPDGRSRRDGSQGGPPDPRRWFSRHRQGKAFDAFL